MKHVSVVVWIRSGQEGDTVFLSGDQKMWQDHLQRRHQRTRLYNQTARQLDSFSPSMSPKKTPEEVLHTGKSILQ